MNNTYTKITVYYDNSQIIRKEDWKTITDHKYFIDSVDKDKLGDFIWNLPYLSIGELDYLNQFLIHGVEIPGLRHCDTQEREDRWRIQIHINYRIFPKAAYLIRQNNIMCNFSGDDNIVLTFSIPKNEKERI